MWMYIKACNISVHIPIEKHFHIIIADYMSALQFKLRFKLFQVSAIQAPSNTVV